MRKSISSLVAAALSLPLLATQAGAAETAHARLADPEGREVGQVVLEETASGAVHLTASFQGLPPGVHGFHIHETGACSPDFKAAGGHYAPAGHAHGVDDPKGRHAGDLPNIHVPADGSLTVEYFLSAVSLSEGAEGSLFKEGGTAFIVHSGADDYRSQPAGAAGDRIACGVIEAGQ